MAINVRIPRSAEYCFIELVESTLEVVHRKFLCSSDPMRRCIEKSLLHIVSDPLYAKHLHDSDRMQLSVQEWWDVLVWDWLLAHLAQKATIQLFDEDGMLLREITSAQELLPPDSPYLGTIWDS